MKQSHWLLCVGKQLWLVKANHATVKLDSSFASRGIKTYSEERLELRKLQFLKKMQEKSSQFLSSDQPSEKLGCCLEYCRSWKIRSENLRLRSTWRPFDLSLERKGALVTVEICAVCGQWISNHFEIVSKTPFSCDAVGRELLWAALLAAVRQEFLATEKSWIY